MIFFFRLNYPLLKWRYQESVYGTKLVGTWNSRPLHDDNRICYIVNDFRWRDVTGQTPQRNGPSLCWFRNRDPHSVSVPFEPRAQPHPTPPPTHLTSLRNLVVIQKPTLTSLRPFWSMNLDPPPTSLRTIDWHPPPSIVIYTEIQTYHSPVRTYPHIDPLVRLPPSELIHTDVGYSAESSVCFLWKKDKVSSA